MVHWETDANLCNKCFWGLKMCNFHLCCMKQVDGRVTECKKFVSKDQGVNSHDSTTN